MTAAEVVLPATNRQISVSATHGGAAACGNARANPVASQTDCRLNVVAESDGDNGDAGADDGQDEGVLGRGRAALVLPKPLREITHRFSPFLCWFPDPPPDVSWWARAGLDRKRV